MADIPFVESKLYGFFEPTFVSTGRLSMELERPTEGVLSPEATPRTRIHDARRLQTESPLSEAGFFDEYGFVLLAHESAVEDWDVDPATPEANNELMRTYVPEIEELIRSRLMPARPIELWQEPPIRRGPGTPNAFYSAGVHQDFGLTPDDYQEGIEAFATPEIARGWRDRYEQDDVAGFLVVDFWRTAGMKGPLEHMPLSVCDPKSVKIDDVVPMGLVDFAPTGKSTNQLALRLEPDQRWYYYPGMTRDEVLVFKNFECSKSDAEPRVASCFHSAFEDPGAPADAEERQSSEHRVNIFCLNA
jgi:hypothetical protein